MIMERLRSVLLASVVLAAASVLMFAQNSKVPPDLTRTVVQAKTFYLVSGHVKYFKTKGFKTRLVEDSPFEEPSHQELEKWGRFQMVEDAESADLILRVYEAATPHPVPVGTVNTGGTGVIILDIVHPASKTILWYTSKNAGLSWSTKTAMGALFKNLREYVEGQDSAAHASQGTAPGTLEPVAAKSEQH
jgi:hypothetical protein